MRVGIVKETFPGEARVALTPQNIAALKKIGCELVLETGAGDAARFPDAVFREREVEIAPSRDDVFRSADVILQVRTYGANPDRGAEDLERMRQGQLIIGMSEPLTALEADEAMARRGVSLFAMELIPRITRAQSMDVLSSMATIAGYKASLMAADHLPKMFPMMMTAAGTVAPAKVLIIGAGVAGLQAIASCRRLGAQVSAYDIRPAVREQVESLGGKFVEMELDAGGSEDKGGYARQMDEEFYRRQREMMTQVVAEHDVVISTAAVPGKKAPILVTTEMVRGMQPGSVIVDLAAERGGNCESTRPGETVDEQGVTILGPLNLPARVPHHASQMYSKNIATFLANMVKEQSISIDREDEIVRETLVAHAGDVVHPKVLEAMGRTTATTED